MRIVEVQPIDTDKIVFLDASAMKDGLVTNGHVALYGIYFDTDKATSRLNLRQRWRKSQSF